MIEGTMKRYKALYNFEARTHDELTLLEGQIVTVCFMLYIYLVHLKSIGYLLLLFLFNLIQNGGRWIRKARRMQSQAG